MNLTFLSVMPTSHWIHYTGFAPNESEYSLGDPINFTSYAEVKVPVEVSWEDILYCDYHDGKGYQYASYYYSAKYYKEPVDLSDGFSWTFNGPAVARPSRCYVHSTVCAHVGMGIKKCQTGRTEDAFNLLPE